MRRRLGFGGTLLATLFACASLTPSLLPRPWLYQGVMGAVTGILGYAAGASLGALGRALIPYRPPERGRRIAWRVMLAGCAVLAVVTLWYSFDWQRDLRALMGMDTRITWFPPVILAVTLVLFGLALLTARLVRLGGRRLNAWLDHYVPTYLGHAVGALVIGLLVAVFANDVLFNGFVARVSDVSSVANQGTHPGVSRPTSAYVSGGPGSLVTWESLGREGRRFTGTAATPARLSAFSGRPAAQPIRVYIGLNGTSSPRAQAALAVRELERTGAFGRPVLAVLGTTGTGWVDPHIADPLEYMYNGRSAMVALQYSYLPSWVSFMVDRDKAAASGRALFEAVRERWSRLPAGSRPRLLLSGESLGSYELEEAFHGLSDLVARADGAVFVGPPNANRIWQQLTNGRRRGSPVWRPVYRSGRTARFAQDPGDLGRPPAPWPHPRVVYLQNSTDPVVWWSPRLLYHRPAWLEGARGPGVNPQMNWFPLVTFWQVLVDMTAALDVPPGHGHRYGANIVDGWAAVAAPPGWSGHETWRLRALINWS
ncbi:alpha/beta-hydrolase family protein [Nonomuraea antimicrobica]|uniref:Alpha/beta-hydrolase family protein n=1 Tax=Nonomuraea antimicrobica TaxID=561173 RepID=A0ABP7BCB0_9ACTN